MRHIVADYFINPTHPITVNVIGCGGTGSQMLTALARIDQALKGLGHIGLHVVAYDPDTVTQANIGRQAFSPADIGHYKATVLISRINRFFGLSWEDRPIKFSKHASTEEGANIFVSCVDTVGARYDIMEGIYHVSINNPRDYQRPYYWLDCGNSKTTGQIILGTVGQISQPKEEYVNWFPDITEMFPDLKRYEQEDDTPSCSMMESLSKQDLFINTMVANLGADLIWKMFKQSYIDYHGAFINLDTMKVNPIMIKETVS